MNKIDDYISNESQRQFSQKKRDAIGQAGDYSLGKSTMSENLAEQLRRAQLEARGKDQSARLCEMQCGRIVFVRDLKDRPYLCNLCNHYKPVLTKLMNRRKEGVIKPKDLAWLARQKTTAVGPFWNPKDPDGNIAKKKAEKASKN